MFSGSISRPQIHAPLQRKGSLNLTLLILEKTELPTKEYSSNDSGYETIHQQKWWRVDARRR